jgi:hypothetical protein
MLEKAWHIILILAMLYGIVFVFVALGSQTFITGRTIVQNVPGTAAVVTFLIILGMGWYALWGSFAWPAFFLLLLIAYAAITTLISMSEERKKRRDNNSSL